jgi:hypothetical protein
MLCDCWLKSAADHNGHAKRASGQAHAEFTLDGFLGEINRAVFGRGLDHENDALLAPTPQPPSPEQKVSVSPIMLQCMSLLLADCVAKVGGTSSDRPKWAILESEGVNF